MNNEIGDLVAKLHPEFNAETLVSASNRISEFLYDLSVQYEAARKFIEDPHTNEYGIVLEYADKDGSWSPSEMNDGAKLYENFPYESYSEDEVYVGLYENWGDCWGNIDGIDWSSRLGVWKDQPTDPEEVVIGSTEERIRHEYYGDFPEGDASGHRYRMRKVILGPFSKKAKEWMYAHIDLFTGVLEARCDDV